MWNSVYMIIINTNEQITDLEKLEAAKKIIDRSKFMTLLDIILDENGKPPLSEEDARDPNSTNRIADDLIKELNKIKSNTKKK